MGIPVRFRPRLVPAVMVAAVALLGVKLVDMWGSFDAAALAVARASESPAKPAPAASPPAASSPARAEASAPIYGKPQLPEVASVTPAGDAARDPLLMSPA